ncbi:MAG: DNA recombination protein RmuC [Bacilli bacterium]|nr:DNA recombination protein RmuC [Bacilli bacterium]
MLTVIVVLVSLLFVLSVVLLVLLIRNRHASISIDDKAIKEAVGEEVGKLQNYLLTGIDAKNENFQLIVKNELNALNTKIEEGQRVDKEMLTSLSESLLASIDKYNAEINSRLKTALENSDKVMNLRLENIERILDTRMTDLKTANEEKLQSIQEVVNEKLEKNLNERLKQSFDSLISEISNVNQAVGEIKNMTKEVGSLRNVLTNVKTRGIVGEVVLGNLIEDVLTKDQYDENVITKPGSNERVEYAIKMPGKGDKTVYMPVDSKFPLEDYRMIKEAIEDGNKDKLSEGRKNLKAKIRAFSKDIRDKYIDVGNTTDFGILFLPIESLYAEVADMGLVEEIQRQYRIVIVSPSTFQALLNALQMGFKSVSIEKKSVEITELLFNVKKQFDSFADALSKTQTSINKASTDLESLVGTRTRQLRRQLEKIEAVGYTGEEKEE